MIVIPTAAVLANNSEPDEILACRVLIGLSIAAMAGYIMEINWLLYLFIYLQFVQCKER